jgi:hypothetical protein
LGYQGILEYASNYSKHNINSLDFSGGMDTPVFGDLWLRPRLPGKYQ